MIEIMKPGIQATIQDMGRVRFRKFGVGFSGAMDPFALAVGNHLVGNDPDAGAIEVTLGGIEIRFHSDTAIALAGASPMARIDDEPLPAWWVKPVHAGQVFKAGMLPRGMRFYLAFAGGVDVPRIMGSRSTDVKGGFGGLEGRVLGGGDRLALGQAPASVVPRGFGLSPYAIPALGSYIEKLPTIRFLPAAEWGDLDRTSRKLLLETAWTVEPESNRMGYRLSGPRLELRKRLEMLSHGIMPGTIQLPPSGLPIIQLNDANTCGGYPKLGVVIAADMHRIGQASLRSSIRFVPVERSEALGAARELDSLLTSISSICRMKRNQYA